MTKRVVIYSTGVCHCSVCAPGDMPIEEIVEQVNDRHPTGIESRWEHSSDSTFHGGAPNPCQCDLDGARMHYLMVC